MVEPDSPSPAPAEPWCAFFAALAERHLASLTFSELRRAVEALSSTYVERRGAALASALGSTGKRSAFALYYGTVHSLAIQALLARRPGLVQPAPRRVVDFGCGTLAAGAAWAVACGCRPQIDGVDRSDWAVREARWTLRALGLAGRVRKGGAEAVAEAGAGDALVAAWAVNELTTDQRDRLARAFGAAARRGARILVVEPVATWATPWWGAWRDGVFEGRAVDEVAELSLPLPDLVERLDRATGLRHARLKLRTLCVGG